MPELATKTRAPDRVDAWVWLALAVVYVVWGSTYLAIRVAIETIPPFLSASVRFLSAGVILFVVAALRGDLRAESPSLRQWGASALVGGAFFLGGNGNVVWAEQRVASGVAALIIATSTLFIVLLARIFYGDRLSKQAVVGILIGFVGVVMLVWPFGDESLRVDLLGAASLTFASFSWASGTLLARRSVLPRRPLLGTSMQMLAGGVLLAVLSFLSGDADRLRLDTVSPASFWALLYLIFFGSILAFTCYIWLVQTTRTSLVATYAYVNPAVAVALGAMILGERITPQMLVAGAVIVLGVALIITATSGRHRATEAAPDMIADERD